MHVLQPEAAIDVVNRDGPVHSLVSTTVFASIGELIASVFIAEGENDVLDVELAIDERTAVVEEIEEVAAEAI